jgi:hypothetical protein
VADPVINARPEFGNLAQIAAWRAEAFAPGGAEGGAAAAHCNNRQFAVIAPETAVDGYGRAKGEHPAAGDGLPRCDLNSKRSLLNV